MPQLSYMDNVRSDDIPSELLGAEHAPKNEFDKAKLLHNCDYVLATVEIIFATTIFVEVTSSRTSYRCCHVRSHKFGIAFHGLRPSPLLHT